MGFRLDGTMAIQYWFLFDQNQSGTPFDALNGGRVLDNDLIPPSPKTALFRSQNLPPAPTVELLYEGFNEAQVSLGGDTVDVTLDLIGTSPDPLFPIVVYRGKLSAFAPPNNQVWHFSSIVQIGPGLTLPPIIGGATLWPLDCCNVCVDPP